MSAIALNQSLPNNLMLELANITQQYEVAIDGLRLYYSQSNPDYNKIFAYCTIKEIEKMHLDNIKAMEQQFAFILLGFIEKMFYLDFNRRINKKYKDELSRSFKQLSNSSNGYIYFSMILENWTKNVNEELDLNNKRKNKKLIGQIQGYLQFRNWFAHGKRWAITEDKKPNFFAINILANELFSQLPLNFH